MSPFCSLLTLSTLLLQISEQHQIVTKTNKDVSLKCFSHIALKYSTSCSNYCCLKPGGWREDSLLFSKWLFTNKELQVYICISYTVGMLEDKTW